MTTICPVCNNEVIVKLGVIEHHQVWKDINSSYAQNGYVTCSGSGRVISLTKLQLVDMINGNGNGDIS